MTDATLPKTLLEMGGASPAPIMLAGATLILIDYQNEYRDGALRLHGVEEATAKGAALLSAARVAGAKIIHIAHKGAPGRPFDRDAERGAIIEAVRPRAGEPVIEKTLPNAFAKTDLASHLGPGASIVIAGFMTHNCVSSTARAALDLGYRMTIVADACATRDLPSEGSVMKAADLHRAELAGLADRHGCVIDTKAFLDAQSGSAA